jgi:hypothetical protein
MPIPKSNTRPPRVTELTLTTLLGAAVPLEGVDGQNRWMGGVQWQPKSTRAISTSAVDVCNPADFVNPGYACEPINATTTTQAAFQVYDALNASHVDSLPTDLEELLDDRWRVMISAAFAKELVGGAASGGTNLAARAHAPVQRAFGAAALTVAQGIAVLEDDLARTLFNGEGVIHMPPGILSIAYAQQIVDNEIDGVWRTPNGHRVVADAGYVDMKEPSGQAASALMTEWIYASGPIGVAATEPEFLGFSANEMSDMTRNKMVRWKNAYGVLVFDPAPVTAVLVNY